MAQLATYVHVHHDGGSTVFGPDDEVPDWAAKLITNPDVWAGAAKQDPGEGAKETESAKRGPGRPPKSEQQR